MKKVAYSVSRQTKEGRNQLKGIGYLSETDLIIACKSKNGYPKTILLRTFGRLSAFPKENRKKARELMREMKK